MLEHPLDKHQRDLEEIRAKLRALEEQFRMPSDVVYQKFHRGELRDVDVVADYCHARITGRSRAIMLAEGVDRRLHELLDRQDRGEPLTPDERQEAEGLVNLAERLLLLRLRAQRIAEHGSDPQ